MDYASSALSASANPSAIHALGVPEKLKLEEARSAAAEVLGAQPSEIIFTSGATESNNLAILGLMHLGPRKEGSNKMSLPHIVTTNIEHASVLEVCKYLERSNRARVTYVPVEPNGIVDPKRIKQALTSETILVSVMYANNEIGTIQPIQEIAKEIRHFNKINPNKIFFHTDAVQAVNYLPIGVPQLGVDLMSLNSSKIYGPKGIGALYIKKNTPLSPIMFGGEQEFGLRPGTENVSLAAEFAQALKEAEKIKQKEVARLIKLRDYFIAQIYKNSKIAQSSVIFNGDKEKRLPNNVNITFPNIPSDLLVIELSAKGIMASEKSACKAGDGKGSHVIEAIRRIQGKTLYEDGSLRFSFGRETTKQDIDYAIKSLAGILTKLKKWYD